MKKNLMLVCIILLIIIGISVVVVKINMQKHKISAIQNIDFEQYLEEEIYGTDIITVINKAISSNELNEVTKDTKGFYNNNKINSIKIDVVMITNVEKNETTVYKMEAISKVGITDFIKNFNTTRFKCTKKEYHLATGKISYIEFTQLAE